MEHEKRSGEDRERYETVRSCIEGGITNAVAAARLGISIRQIRRLKRAVEKQGERGVMHGNRSRVPWNATLSKTKTSIVTFLKKKNHRDFGPTFAMEQLAKQRQIVLSRESVRAIMIGEGLRTERKRRGPGIHRQWRERKAMYGELIQFDGSYHDWLEMGEKECLLGAIDDATSIITRAIFDDNEGVYAVFRFWWRYIEAHGRPVAIYLDKFSTYKINHKAAVDNEELITQFQRAMGELDIRVICANSPEAKGRIERLFGTLQDRLVKEMRLAGIRDRKSANSFLTETYLPEHNKRFVVSPQQEGDAHRRLTTEHEKRLPAIFSIQSERMVRNDYTIQFKNKWYQLTAEQPIAIYPNDAVTVEEWLDGTLHMRFKDAYLSFTLISKLERSIRPRVEPSVRQSTAHKPAQNHPWILAAKRAAEQAAARKLRNAR